VLAPAILRNMSYISQNFEYTIAMRISLLFVFFCFIISYVHTEAFAQRYIGKDHYNHKTGEFFNTYNKNESSFMEFLKWKFWDGQDAKLWPEWIDNEFEPSLPISLEDHEVAITFINHATLLIQINGLNILTDPVWSERVSPVSWIGPKRVRAPGLDFDRLPKIDLVIISHNHYDHMDLATLKKISQKHGATILVPIGDRKLLQDEGIKNVKSLDWWSTEYFKEKFKVTFTPAQHFSSRGLFDKNESLWGGYIIRFNDYKIFFAGDTGYSQHFKDIHKRFGPMDISFLPIGAYAPRWFMKTVHMNPAEAVKAHQDLKSKYSIGMHFGTFQLTDEAIYKPVEELQRAKLKNNIPGGSFGVLDVGQTLLHKLMP